MIDIGASIEVFFETIDKTRFSLNVVPDKDVKVSTLKGKYFTIIISVHPKKWLSMELDVQMKGLRRISYQVDSDLYSPSDTNLHYYQNIEKDILNVLEQVVNSRVKIGKKRRQTILVIPRDNHYIVLERGIFLTKQQEVERLPNVSLVALI